MSAQEKVIWLGTAMLIVLSVASSVGWVLSRRAGPEDPGGTIGNLNARINSWWTMLGVFALSFYLGRLSNMILFGFISFFALREFLTLTPTRRGDHIPLSIAFFLILPAQYYLIGVQWYGMFSIYVPVYAFLFMALITALTGDTEDYLARVAKTQWGLMICVYCLSHVPALLILDIPGYAGHNALLLFFLLAVVQLSDVFQYIVGKLIGKTPLAPTVSPSKTVEGLIGGGALAVLSGTALWWITPFSVLEATAIAMVIVFMGFAGGLTLSAVKRSIGAKDWGQMIRGHGGMLDRMDSVTFSAPIFFHIVRYFYSAG